jgi:hypothetical protein
MRNINIFKNRVTKKDLSANEIFVLKGKKLKEIDDYAIWLHLYNKLNNICLGGSTIYDILYDDSRRGFTKYNNGGECIYISTAVSLGMESSDFLVNGNLVPEHPDGFEHQWVEFCYFGKWYVIDSAWKKIFDRSDYYLAYNPFINFKKSNAELMEDDFVRKHAELLKNPEWSYDDELFFYYRDKKIEECKKRLYGNIETDENGHIISYNNIDIQKSHSR